MKESIINKCNQCEEPCKEYLMMGWIQGIFYGIIASLIISFFHSGWVILYAVCLFFLIKYTPKLNCSWLIGNIVYGCSKHIDSKMNKRLNPTIFLMFAMYYSLIKHWGYKVGIFFSLMMSINYFFPNFFRKR